MADSSPKVFKVITSNASSISSNTTELENLLSKIGNKEVAVYSINGKFKTGKSFLLNCMLKFLLYGKSNQNDWINANLPSQFACDGGSNKCTVGIDVWPQVFFVDVGNGKEVAVLLMDTQGLFDDESPVTDNQTVFAFSALLSSFMIYNVMNTMDQRDWQFLDFLMDFVNQAVHFNSQSGDDKSNLNILIRDWENNNEFPFGNHSPSMPKNVLGNLFHHFFESGGQEEVLESPRDNRNIVAYFNKCSVTAMPYPGKELATTKNAAASSGDAEFIQALKSYVEGLFSPDVVLSNRKKVGGSFVTGETLSQLVSKWATYFQSNSLPAPHSVYLSTAELQHMNLIKQLEEEFRISMGNDLAGFPNGHPTIGELFRSKVATYTQKFDNSQVLGKQDFAGEYKDTLCRNLETAFKMFAHKNEEKIQFAAAQRQRNEVERLRKIQEEQVKRAAEQARLEAERKRYELQRWQEELERKKREISSVQLTPVPGTHPQQYDVVLGGGTFCMSQLVPPGCVIRNLTITGNVTLN